ncbi:MAG: 3-keto-5-aminohexanoate cleavage protein [Clostridia bacterium]|nr:3-keto-5-aminohexanoate cleavage protein [Clostridia bacterium]MBN2882912.1 3-keto-5-aminohexanoate cleavage protein [Clostridia bacterium]
MEKIILTAAICGAEVTKEQNPNVPYTVMEIAHEARRAFEAGAAIIHLHVRYDDGTPTQDIERFSQCIDAIKSLCPGVIVQPSTGGAAGMKNDERLQPLGLDPEMATLDCGTLNFGEDDIFVNSIATIKYFAEKMRERNIMPELEVFDRSMINTALYLYKKDFLGTPLHFNLVMGVKGGIGASLGEFSFLKDSLPPEASFTATGIGRNQFNIAAMAAVTGGHIRVGFEDNIYISPGELAVSNGQLVEKAIRIAGELGRIPATPDEARNILKIRRGAK